MDRIVTIYRRVVLATAVVVIAWTAAADAQAQAEFYYLGIGFIPTDLSADGSVAVGNIQSPGGTFVEQGGYFDWVRDRDPNQFDPRAWVLPINGGTVGGGGSIGGDASISDDGRYVAGTAFHLVDASEYQDVNPGFVSGNYSAMSLLDRDTVEYEFDPVDGSLTSVTANWQNLGGIGGEIDDDLSSGYDISGDGQHVVGLGWTAPTVGRGADAIVWSTGGDGVTALPRAFPLVPVGDFSAGARSARANAVSGDGSVVAGWQDGPGNRNAAIWKDGVAIKRLTNTGEASAVSANGEWVVGIDAGYELPGDFNNNRSVSLADYTVWRDKLGGSAVSLPNDVDGGTVGQVQYETWKSNLGAVPPAPETYGGNEAWRWSEETGLETLGCFFGASCATGDIRGYAVDVSADGSVILGFDRGFGTILGTGWIWEEGVGMMDLKAYFASYGIDVTGYTFGTPLAMSADGRTFAGLGFDSNDLTDSGWIVTLPPLTAAVATAAVPEPSTVALLLMGIGCTLASRRRSQNS